jgi:acyl-CoA thioester hydrolase
MDDTTIHLSSYTCRIYYEDVDTGGICYHSKYLNFCERARSEIFFSKGASPIDGDYHFVVKHINADFLQPAYFSDTVRVDTYLKESKAASIMLHQTVSKKDTLLFSMNILLVCLKGDRVTKMPAHFQSFFS